MRPQINDVSNKWKKMNELRFFPNGSNWKKVLLEVYNNSPHNHGESNKVSFNDNDHPLAKKLKITGYELMLAISFLRDNKLIKDSPSSHQNEIVHYSNQISLTEYGFEVAVKIESELINEKTQSTLVILTIIIAFTGFIGLFFESIKNNQNIFLIILLYGFSISIGILFYNFNNIITKLRRWRYYKFIKNGGSVVV